ncbi:conserved membrane hypothetical protein [anaerobic digester metagenome]|uniref:Uncharacterized protein n=1 Tax=anaerobic digester metagenome TaxID=1263854 RepID=A0A485LWI1_9ZZZZ
MKTIAFLLSLFVTATGLLGFISPGMLISMVRRFAGPLGVYAAAGIRLIMGLALYLSAPVSRIPHAVRALGDITLAAGAVTPFFGPERFRAALAWWSAQGPAYIRAWSLVAVAIGLFTAWSLAPAGRKRITHIPSEHESGVPDTGEGR